MWREKEKKREILGLPPFRAPTLPFFDGPLFSGFGGPALEKTTKIQRKDTQKTENSEHLWWEKEKKRKILGGPAERGPPEGARSVGARKSWTNTHSDTQTHSRHTHTHTIRAHGRIGLSRIGLSRALPLGQFDLGQFDFGQFDFGQFDFGQSCVFTLFFRRLMALTSGGLSTPSPRLDFASPAQLLRQRIAFPLQLIHHFCNVNTRTRLMPTLAEPTAILS